MEQNTQTGKIAFLELKYGPLHGGHPNFHVVNEAAVIIYDPQTDEVKLERSIIKSNLDIVFHYADTDELGSTTRRFQKVINLQSGLEKPFDPDLQLPDRFPHYIRKNAEHHQTTLKRFMIFVLKNHHISELVTFGERDMFIITKAGVKIRDVVQTNLQRDVSRATNYYFSLNKLSKSLNFELNNTDASTHNFKYTIPIVIRALKPNTAVYDSVRLFLIYKEYKEATDNFMLKTALQLQKIEMMKKEK